MEEEKRLSFLERNVVDLIRREELLERLKGKRPLRIKFGADPTAPDIHLGHTVILRKLREFQEFGHRVILIIGDFTARIGDPSGRVKTRKPLTPQKIEENARTYREQVFRILLPERTEVRYNSEWLGKLNLSQFLKLTSHYTVARMLERDDFSLRYQDGYPIGIHEFLYPLLQAYDSVVLKADVEIGGTDQKFNLVLGREIQKSFGQPPQVIITMPLLEGTDGKEKMSKSLGNYIGVTEPPREMYGKLMSIPDELIFKYLCLLTSLEEEEIEKKEKDFQEGLLHPKELKKELARRVVAFFYGEGKAKEEEEEFEAVFTRKEKPQEIPLFLVEPEELKGGKVWIVRLLTLCGLAPSRSEARRLIQQGGVRVDGEKIGDENLEIPLGEGERILRVGKRKFLRVRLKSSKI